MNAVTLRPRYAIATLGSAGDLHPFLAVARALHERGEDVRLLSAEPHRAEVESQGVPFMPILDAAAHQRTLQHPGLWHPIGGFGVLWRHMVVPAIDPTLAALRQLCADKRPVRVLASPLTIGARLARELLPLHLSTGHLAPMSLRTCDDPMSIGAWPVPPWVPRSMRRGLWSLLDRYKLEPMAAPRLNAWRQAHGLAPLNEPVFARWLHSPDQVLGLFPDTFGPMPRDWPVTVRCTGFALYEPTAATEVPTDPVLQAFCAADAAPLAVFFLGSVADGCHAAMAEAASALAASGAARCLWIGQTEDDPRSPPPGPAMLKRPWVSLAHVLPHARLFMHRGGIGCCAQGLAAGVRQLLLPAVNDQFNNSARLQHMGAGHGLSPAQQQRGDVVLAHLQQALRQAPPPRPNSAWQASRPGAPNAAVQAVCAALSGG